MARRKRGRKSTGCHRVKGGGCICPVGRRRLFAKRSRCSR